jgi:inorganic pyrophosphatase
MLSSSLLLLSLVSPGALGTSNILHSAQPQRFPSETLVVVEIQPGSTAKYEIDKETGHLFLDRFLSAPQGYPCHYGSVCQTKGPDGDPLDVLLYSRLPIQPGVLVRVRPIGTMKMIDGGEQDDKVIAVPTDRVDPTMSGITELAHLPSMELDRLKLFFETYKKLPAGGKEVTIPGFGSPQEAHDLLRAGRSAFLDPKLP